MGPEHWAQHIRQPVLFTQVVKRLARDGCTIFLEISPQPLLSGAIKQTLNAFSIHGVALGSCRRSKHERASLLKSLGRLYISAGPLTGLRSRAVG